MLRRFTAAPDSGSVLCTVMAPGAFSYMVPYHRFGHQLEVWPLPERAAVAASLPHSHTATRTHQHDALVVRSIPLQESVPIGFDARPTGARNMAWHPCFPSTLLWTEALDGGDPKALPPDEKTGYRDMMYTHAVERAAGGSGGGSTGAALQLAAGGARPLIGCSHAGRAGGSRTTALA